MDNRLDELVTQVRAGAKYAQVNADLVRRIGAMELAKRRSLKDAIKETKNTLHQVAGMFAEEKAQYGEWMEVLGRVDFPLQTLHRGGLQPRKAPGVRLGDIGRQTGTDHKQLMLNRFDFLALPA